MKITKLFYLLLILIIFFLPGAAYAQSFSLSLSPEKHEIISKRGQTITLPYSLSNLGDPQLLSLNVHSLKAADESKAYELSPFEQSANAPGFAVVNAEMELGKPFLMNGKSTVLFDLQITVPQNVPQRDYYFTFIAESEGMKGAEGQSSIQLEGGVGSHILLTVTDTGQIDHSAQIALFDIPSAYSIKLKGEKYYFVDSFRAIPFGITLVNNGKNYIKTSGTISTSSNAPLKLPESTILASSTETFSSTLVPGLFTQKIVGIDTITATFTVADSQVLYANTRIIALPILALKVLMAVLVTTATVFLFLQYKRKK